MKDIRLISVLKRLLVVSFILCLQSNISGIAQNTTNDRFTVTEVHIRVTDEQHNPLTAITVQVSGEAIYLQKMGNESFVFNATISDMVEVSSFGFEAKEILVASLLKDEHVELKKSKLFMSNTDYVDLPYHSIKKKRFVTGSYNVIKGNRLEENPTSDLRNAFTGIANGLEIREMDGQPGFSSEEENGIYNISEKIGVTSRGLNMIYIIDDVPMNVTEMPLDPSDISSVTIIKDVVGKNLFGTLGAKGLINIRTKRGKANQRALNVNFEYGVSAIDRMPDWVGGADYAQLNNLARQNSGLPALYSNDAITAFSSQNPYDLRYPNVNFRQLMINDIRPIRRVSASYSGGNDRFQHYSSLSHVGEGDNYKIGSTADYNRITLRTNMDLTLSDALSVRFDIFGNMSYRRSPNYGYNASYENESNTSLDINEMTSVLSDITSIPPISFPIYAGNDEENTNNKGFGVSDAYLTNPIGNLTKNGYYTETGKNSAINILLDYDMGSLIEGLSSKTFFGFNIFNLVRIGKAEDYPAYLVTPINADSIQLSRVHPGAELDEEVRLHDYYFQRFFVYENLSYQKTFGLSDISTSLTLSGTKMDKNGVKEPRRSLSSIYTASYTYDDKYTLQGVLNYSGTYWLEKKHRWSMFPSVGLSWILSEEPFMRSVRNLDYVKLRAEYGISGVDNLIDPFYYSTNWTTNKSGASFGPYSSGQWFGSNTDVSVPRSSLNRLGNPNLTWETIKEFTAGIDILMLSKKLNIELNYYNNLRENQIVLSQNIIPGVAGVSSADFYINGQDVRYYGLETGLQFSDRKGRFSYSIGGNATLQNSNVIRADEPNYRNSYQSRIGKPLDTYFGHTYLGKIAPGEEAMAIPTEYDAQLSAGDLLYKDMNRDGLIDDNDMSPVGHTIPRMYYSINLRMKYKNFDFSVVGTGRAFYDIPMTNKYFQNGWGNDNYSAFVKDNMGDSYPRLTYYKVNNNFTPSNFWLTDGSYFKIQMAEFAYNLPNAVIKHINSRGVRLFVRGANLVTLSKIKDVDPESINSGVTTYPLNKTYTVGLKLTI